MNDRLLTDILELPNSLNDLRFNPNSLSNNKTFNDKISLIQENYDYLKGKAEFINNNSPASFSRVYYFDPNYLGWDTLLDPYKPADNHGYNDFHVIQKSDGSFGYILVGSDKIDFYYGDNLLLEGSFDDLTLQTTFTETQNVGNQKFSNIKTTHLDGNILYVYDENLKVLFVYDITNIQSDDDATHDIKVVSKLSHQTGIKSIVSGKDFLYIVYEDKLSKLSKRLNNIKTIDIDFSSVDIEEVGDYLYILNESGNVWKYTKDLELVKEYKIPSINISIAENYIKIQKSKLNDNIVYIVSDKFIHKCFINKLSDYFSHFEINSDKSLKAISSFVMDDEETVLILDENKIMLTTDRNDLIVLYSIDNLRDEFNIDQLLINDLELEQDFVYNAIIQRVTFNHILFVNSILHQISYQVMNNKPKYNGLLNVKKSVISTINTTFGLNEVFSYQVFQRFIDDIHRIQMIIVDLLQVNVEGDVTVPLTL